MVAKSQRGSGVIIIWVDVVEVMVMGRAMVLVPAAIRSH